MYIYIYIYTYIYIIFIYIYINMQTMVTLKSFGEQLKIQLDINLAQ